MKALQKKHLRKIRRKKHVRKRVSGTAERPRLTVFRSHQNMYAQLIDDDEGQTLVAASTRDADVSGSITGHRGNKAAAARVGEVLAAKAAEKGIKRVVFDRNGYPFHGRVRELADAARKGGLEF